MNGLGVEYQQKYLRMGTEPIHRETAICKSGEHYFYYDINPFYVDTLNKLAYDMEIEAIYLVGDFTVKTPGQWTPLERDAVRYCGSFEIDAPKQAIDLKHMEQQGYPFFSGEMVLEGELNITGENPVLQIERRGFNAVKVEIDSVERWMLTNDKLSLKDFGVQGRVKVRLTLINNLRNLLGPHHLKEGECLSIGPGKFFKEPCVWNWNPEVTWNDDYCFVVIGIF